MLLQDYIRQWMSATKNSAAMVRAFRMWLSQFNLSQDTPSAADLKIMDQTTVAVVSVTAADPDKIWHKLQQLAAKHGVTLISNHPLPMDNRPETYV